MFKQYSIKSPSQFSKACERCSPPDQSWFKVPGSTRQRAAPTERDPTGQGCASPSPTTGQRRARDSRARLAAPTSRVRGDTAAAQGLNPSCDPPSSSNSPDFWGSVLVKCATAILLSCMVCGRTHLPLLAPPRDGTASRLHASASCTRCCYSWW